MIRAIIAWSLANRPLVLLGALALVAVGLHAASQLNVEAYPDPTPPLVEVISQSPGASPEEMERLVGIPLETALNGKPGVFAPNHPLEPAVTALAVEDRIRLALSLKDRFAGR